MISRIQTNIVHSYDHNFKLGLLIDDDHEQGNTFDEMMMMMIQIRTFNRC